MTHVSPDQASLPLSAPDRTRVLPSYLRDHRKRLRDRFVQGGAAAMPDYELLELVLFRAIQRRDVKPVAHRLIARFGSFGGVLSAPADQLRDVPDVGDAVIVELKIVEAAAQRLARARLHDRPVLSCWQSLLDYCQATLAHHPVELFRVFFLDNRNRLIADEEQGRGTVNHVPVYPREVLKRALQLNATALIVVHNHPSGDPTPSQADIAMTRQIVQAGEVLGITVHDHIVIGKSCEVSFRSAGLL